LIIPVGYKRLRLGSSFTNSLNRPDKVNSLLKASSTNYYNKYYCLNRINIKGKATVTTYIAISTKPKIKINTYYVITTIKALNNKKYKSTISTFSYLKR